MNCPNQKCGCELDNDDIFMEVCPHCGLPFDSDDLTEDEEEEYNPQVEEYED